MKSKKLFNLYRFSLMISQNFVFSTSWHMLAGWVTRWSTDAALWTKGYTTWRSLCRSFTTWGRCGWKVMPFYELNHWHLMTIYVWIFTMYMMYIFKQWICNMNSIHLYFKSFITYFPSRLLLDFMIIEGKGGIFW